MKPEDFKKVDPTKWYRDGNQIYVNIKTINLNLDCGLCRSPGIIRIENVMIDEQTGKAAILMRDNPIALCEACQLDISNGSINEILRKLIDRELKS
jgi:hypothetical protein